MRMRIKQRKSSAFPCNAGGRCSLSAVVWSLVGFILIIHFYSLARHHESVETRVRLNRFPLTRELEEIEEENFQLQPRGKRSPRAAKRRGNRKTSLIDEFLDDSSQIRLLFFPDHKTAFGPTKSTANDSMYYHPGRLWLDTEGNAIQAHGGGILYDERTETYYWYGENKDGPTYQAHKKGTARCLSRSHAPLDKHIHNLINESAHSMHCTGDNEWNASYITHGTSRESISSSTQTLALSEEDGQISHTMPTWPALVCGIARELRKSRFLFYI